MTGETNDIQAALTAGQQIGAQVGKIQQLQDSHPFVVLPVGTAFQSLADQRLKGPERLKASPTFIDVTGFTAYVNDFKRAGSRIFADPKGLRLVAVIDYHDPKATDPSWCSHTATLALSHSPEWTAWINHDRRPQAQEPFCEFLEDHITEIAEPAAAVLQDAVRNIQLIRTVTTRAFRDLGNGTVQLSYVDEENQEGSTVVPKALTLALRYFRGGDAFAVTARLRYKPEKGAVTFTYLMDGLDRLAEQQFGEACKNIAEATGLPVLQGLP